MWTNSQIVLYWLQNMKKLKQHCVTEILQLTANAAWRYCPTADNPADLLTRGITPTQLQSSLLWRFGPQWLTTCDNWPVWQPSTNFHLQAAVISTSGFVLVTTSPTHHRLHQIVNLMNYSTLSKVVRVTAFVLCFVSNIKTNPAKKLDHSQQLSYMKPR